MNVVGILSSPKGTEIGEIGEISKFWVPFAPKNPSEFLFGFLKYEIRAITPTTANPPIINFLSFICVIYNLILSIISMEIEILKTDLRIYSI